MNNTAIQELKQTATELTEKGNDAGALDAWQKVIQAKPEDMAARQRAAELLVKLGRPKEAVEAYEFVSRHYAERGLFFKASAVCRLALAIDPTHQAAQQLIASLYSRDTSGPTPPPMDAAQSADLTRPSPTPVPVKASPPPPAHRAVTVDAVEPPPPTSAAPSSISSASTHTELTAPPTASGLPSIPLFSMLAVDELKEVLRTAMEVRAYRAGEVAIHEGEGGESMFALVEGGASVHRGWGTANARRVAALAPGEIFGEVALVSRMPRVATVVLDVDSIALEFPRETMAAVITKHPHVGQMLGYFYRERLLANMMRANAILRGLPEAEKSLLSARFHARTFKEGERIITEGQPAGAVFMIMRGICTATHQSGERYPDLREGDLFGEVSVLTGGAATATVTATTGVLALSLSGEEFKAAVLKDPAASQAVAAMAKIRLDRTARFDKLYKDDGAPDTRV